MCSVEDAEERMKSAEGAEADKKSEQEDSGVESPNANRTIQLEKKVVVVDKETSKSDAATSTAEEKKDSTSTPPVVPPPSKGE